MLMTIKDRLIKYLEYKGISKRQFELSIGVSNGYINNMRVSIQPYKVRNIALHYPDLNTGWLMTGEGEMLKGEDKPERPRTVTIEAEAWQVIKQQAESLASKDRQMEALLDILKKGNVQETGNAACADAK